MARTELSELPWWLGARIRYARQKRELTQGETLGLMRDLERRAGRDEKDFKTVAQSGWSKIERGKVWPSVEVFAIFCRALNVSPSELLE